MPAGARGSYLPQVSRLALSLPATDLAALRFRIRRLAQDRPGTYRMVDAAGRVLYVGKARSLRKRLLSYFSARYPEDKQARILHAASDILFDPSPGEFAAALTELSLIRRFRPPFNVAMNRNRKHAFLVITDEAAPRLLVSPTPDRLGGRIYGPFPSPTRLRAAARVLGDLLGIRDCRADMPMQFGEQNDLFDRPRRAACPRFDFGICLGPCAGLVSDQGYRERVESAVALCEGTGLGPMARVIEAMTASALNDDFERALLWREKFELLEWFLASVSRNRTATKALTFVYRDPGTAGDARAYLVMEGAVLASYPDPVTPLEREAFAAVVREKVGQHLMRTSLRPDIEQIHQRMLVSSWFRRHPEAWRGTTPIEEWTTLHV